MLWRLLIMFIYKSVIKHGSLQYPPLPMQLFNNNNVKKCISQDSCSFVIFIKINQWNPFPGMIRNVVKKMYSIRLLLIEYFNKEHCANNTGKKWSTSILRKVLHVDCKGSGCCRVKRASAEVIRVKLTRGSFLSCGHFGEREKRVRKIWRRGRCVAGRYLRKKCMFMTFRSLDKHHWYVCFITLFVYVHVDRVYDYLGRDQGAWLYGRKHRFFVRGSIPTINLFRVFLHQAWECRDFISRLLLHWRVYYATRFQTDWLTYWYAVG